MSSLKFSMIFVFLLSLSSSLFTLTSAADPTYLYHICSGNNFTRNSTYETNLNLVLYSLPSNGNRSDGFSNASTGQDPNRAYGLFQCRGDVSTTTCKDCVTFASTDVTQRCPGKKRAVIWYDECLLRYSNSTSSQEPGILMYNENNVTIEPSRFRQLMFGQMNEAATQAANDPKKFATRKGNFTTSQPLYTLVQCTQDLSNTACLGCLQQAISSLPSERIGARILTPRCICRYELYPFYNENLTVSPPSPALTPSPPSPVTRPKGKSGISASIIIAIVAPITAAAVLFVAGYCFLTRRARRKNGYMAPEYAMHGQLSVKSDVFSFGVLVLEIITGKKNSNFYQTDGAADLLSYVWKHWRDGTPTEVLDSNLTDSYSRNEVMRCIHVGLLCVQEDPTARPTMATIVLMLNSYSVTLPLPQQPAFFFGTGTEFSIQITNGMGSDQSKSKSVPWSVDDASITEVQPR
ncbi:hypothetical protein Dsin_027808 [Dipteronia sinensis]|uniref:Gnk2-homologous domain-containing protein n=1 Tax=Dipteronia sinensis TaxID=43782 RepID=A0AAE0DUY4_9ROSI|nr:hypothetical protein Dsin_027808 [Dipteronia sinensis]